MNGQRRKEGSTHHGEGRGGERNEVRGGERGSEENNPQEEEGARCRIPEKRKKGRGVGGVRGGTIRAQREAKTS